MKKIKIKALKTLAAVLAVVLCFSCFGVCPVLTALDADAVVYVSATGDDKNAGTVDAPVATLKGAYAALYSKMQELSLADSDTANGKIIVSGTVNVPLSGTTAAADTAYPYTVTVTGAAADSTLNFSSSKQTYYNHMGPVKYENITLKYSSGSNYCTFHSAGESMIFGKGVKTVPNSSGEYLSLSGAPHGTTGTFDSTIEVYSGDWRIIYLSGYTSKTVGNRTLIMDGASAVRICSGYAYMSGETKYDVKNSTIGTVNFGPYNTQNTKNDSYYSGNVTLLFDNVTVSGNMENGTVYSLPGKITANIKNSTVGGNITTSAEDEVNFTFDKLNITSGNTKILTGGTFNVQDFVGGGKLILGADSMLNVENVQNSTELDFSGVPDDRAYVKAPLGTSDLAFNYLLTNDVTTSTDSTYKYWNYKDSGQVLTAGALFRAPAGVSLSLYAGFVSSSKGLTAITPTSTGTVSDYKEYFYESLAVGQYTYEMSGTGYYTTYKSLNFSAEKAAVRTVIIADPGKKSGKGYEPSSVQLYTDETENNILSAKAEWKTKYSDVYLTPSLKPDATKAKHEVTSQSEMETFVTETVNSCDNMYEFTLAVTPGKGLRIPIVFFSSSDLSGAKTYAEALEILKTNGKLNVMYEAQIHGNEPAAGEGALAILKSLSGDYGKEVLKVANMVILPRANPDGSADFVRQNGSNGIDLNRDHIKSTSEEITAIHDVYNKLLPDVFIDGHEYTAEIAKATASASYRDILFAVGGGYNSSKELISAGTNVTNSIIDNLWSEGIRSTYYPATSGTGGVKSGLMINTANFSSGRGYYSLRGTITLLVETRGINIGKQSYERRVVSQYITITSLLNYIIDHTSEIRDAVNAERERIINSGKTYDSNSKFALLSGSAKENIITLHDPKINLINGTVVSSTSTSANYYYDIALRSRTRPTAYVIPADMADINAVLELISKHDIYYYKVNEKSTVNLRQYIEDGTTGEFTDYGVKTAELAKLSETKSVEFNNGMYVFPLNQVSGTLLMYLFEPDVTDTRAFDSSLVQSGTIKALADGSYPIFRYEANLNSDGTIKIYNATPAPQDIVVTNAEYFAGNGKISGLLTDRTYKYRLNDAKDWTFVEVGAVEVSLPIGRYELTFADDELAASFYFTITGPSASEVFVDFNGDEKVDIEDATYIASSLVNNVTLTAEQLKKADINGDGKVDINDVVLFAKYAGKKVEKEETGTVPSGDDSDFGDDDFGL